MRRAPNIRQIEAFKAVMELGTVTRAANQLCISQPAVSKLLAYLEEDTELKLFERHKGRLTPTSSAMQLYDSVKRLFVGMNKLDAEINLIRRGKQNSLSFGVLPALTGPYIAELCSNFIEANPGTQLSTTARSSHYLRSWLTNHELDAVVIEAPIQVPDTKCLPVLEAPLVCIMSPDHALSQKSEITPYDLDNVDFIDFELNSNSSKLQQGLFQDYGVLPRINLSVNTSPFMAEFVARGLGVALVHPLALYGRGLDVIAKPFKPDVVVSYYLAWSQNNANQNNIEAFVDHMLLSFARTDPLSEDIEPLRQAS